MPKTNSKVLLFLIFYGSNTTRFNTLKPLPSTTLRSILSPNAPFDPVSQIAFTRANSQSQPLPNSSSLGVITSSNRAANGADAVVPYRGTNFAPRRKKVATVGGRWRTDLGEGRSRPPEGPTWAQKPKTTAPGRHHPESSLYGG